MNSIKDTKDTKEFVFKGAKAKPKDKLINKKPISIIVLTTRLDAKQSKAPTVKKISEKAESMGFKCIIIDTDSGEIEKTETGSFFIKNKGYDKKYEIDTKSAVILARRSSISTTSAIKFFEKLESLGFVSINSLKSVLLCEDKLDTVRVLDDKGIPVPRTALISYRKDVESSLEKIGNKFPVVLKLLTGTKGIGVFQCDSHPSLISTLQTIWKLSPETELILQEKIEADSDLRIHVLGSRNIDDSFSVIGSMMRKKIDGDFRTNVSLGGEAVSVEIQEEIVEIAIESAKATGCSWCGVDIIIEKGTGKPYVLEVNSSPGTDGIEDATGLDVTGIILDFILDKKNWAYPRKIVGFRENFDVKGIGSFIGKLDTGNGAIGCSLHADNYTIEDGILKWHINDKSFSHRIVEYSYAEVGDEKDKRPVVLLDVEFSGMVYKKVKFSMVDRSKKSTPLLINRAFMELAGLIIDSSKTFLCSKEPKGYTPAKAKNDALAGIRLY